MRAARVVVAVILVLGAVSAVPSAAAAGPTGAVRGTVTVDRSGGTGIAGVRVLVLDRQHLPQPVVATVTDANGRYSLLSVSAADSDLSLCFDASDAEGAPPEGFLSACGGGTPWAGPDAYPPGVSLYVEAGRTQTDNVSLRHGAGISGAVTSTDGTPLAGVVVRLGVNEFEAHTTTGSDGTYHLRGVIPARPEGVCFDATGATGASPTGYLSECWQHVPWLATTTGYPPRGARPIRVAADVLTTGIDATLGPAAVLTGTVRAQVGGAPLPNLQVRLAVPDANATLYAVTAANGDYRFTGLRTASNDTLCVDATYPGGPSRAVAYQSECWHDQLWDPDHDDSDVAPTADPVAVTEGASSRVDFELAATGHIAGVVTTAAGAPIPAVQVTVYRASSYPGARLYEDLVTDAAGRYDVGGLAPSATGYRVCFSPLPSANASRPGGYRAECFDDQYLNSSLAPIPTSTLVPVAAGATSTVDARLALGTEFAGHVTAPGGPGIGGVTVVLFDAAGAVVATRTSAARTGSYDFVGVVPRGSYHVCALGVAAARYGVASSGAAGQCNGGTAWDGAFAAPTGTPLATAAGTSTRVDFALGVGGGISGTTGGTGNDYDVFVFDAAGHRLGQVLAFTPSRRDPTYRIVGLSPDLGPYRVCFGTADRQYGHYYGVVPFCWNGPSAPAATWDGADADLPDVATVAVVAGGEVTGIDGGALTSGAVITGTVFAGSAPSVGTAVSVFAPTGSVVRTAVTSSTGTYVAAGLNPSTGPYRVCAGAAPGYQPRCWRTAAWSGSGPPPAGAAARAVTSGRARSGIDIRLLPV